MSYDFRSHEFLFYFINRLLDNFGEHFAKLPFGLALDQIIFSLMILGNPKRDRKSGFFF